MFKTVTVIGVGTLGGFLCKHLSELDNIKRVIAVDNDIVESKNVYNSIYSYEHVGDYKVNALEDLINENVAVTKLITQYNEGETNLPKSDLVIDCRDVVCDRINEIDVRLYISDRMLIVDCRKQVRNVCSYDGSYRIVLTKNEISKAAFFAAQIINSDQLLYMITNNVVERINLDLLPELMSSAVKKTLENRVDIIYDTSTNGQRLQCLPENINPILRGNTTNDLKVYVGSKSNSVHSNLYSLIPKNSLTKSRDVITTLTEIVKQQNGYSNFIVTVREENGIPFIELIEETGAA